MSLRKSVARLAAGWRSLTKAVAERRHVLAKVGLRAAAAGALVLIVLLIHRSVYMAVISSPEFRIPKNLARANVAPSWADPSAPESVVTLPAGRASLLDPDLVHNVAASFEANPWVRRVIAVERLFPDQVRVRLEMRAVRLAVRRPGGYILVDREGVRLPGAYERAPKAAMEVVGAAGVPPVAGRTWEGAEIAAALELASVAEGEAFLRGLNLRMVDVSNVNGRRDPQAPELGLVTASGSVIGWGRAPSAARFGEPSIGEKLDNLRRTAENYPRLEGVAVVKVHQKGPARVRLMETGVVRKPK
ncbi:MAG TPA: hypothetical protein VK661_01680 [Planctomycetota bacterium]|nr:hypothetical protein [Planctomycetota bacterium]